VWVSEGMNGIANVFDIRENPDLSKYEYVVGGSILMGETSKELQAYLAKHNDVLKGKVKVLFAVCGNVRQLVNAEQYSAFIEHDLKKYTGASEVLSKEFCLN